MTHREVPRHPPRPAQASSGEPVEESTLPSVSARMSDADAERVLATARQRLLARGDEAALLASLPEAPEKKLDAIQTLLLELSTISAQITPELYRDDPAAFTDAVTAAGQRIQQIETLLVTFLVATQTEYPKITVWQKLILALATIIHGTGRETNLLLALSRAETKRKQLLSAEPKLQALLGQHRDQIERVQQELKDERERPIRVRQEELLSRHAGYQRLKVRAQQLSLQVSKVPFADRAGYTASQYHQLVSALTDVNAELTALERAAFDRAQEEISQRAARRQ